MAFAIYSPFSITYNSNSKFYQMVHKLLLPFIHTDMRSFNQKDVKIPNGRRKAWEALGSKPEILRSLTGTGRTPQRKKGPQN